ncbi:UNVERIFIED_ORG: general secretion pathway protein N [Xanthobacter viscosus]|uniref:General secretion pathway protein GspN n=2 Tax=Pseudomonadota TaxID=1224 RepID=A0A6C1KFL2_XANAU|nr:general secretion pathway protein GspN [Xanthobacter autotrophicus]TLX42014.1 general secretion pathway protein GspN [Xanthobacter autotrophicus]
MSAFARASRFALLAVVLVVSGTAATASDLDTPIPPANPVQVRAGEGDGAAGSGRAGTTPRGNPLWSLPLDRLEATRARPLFTPGRRPPAVAEPPPAPTPAAPVATAPARPRITLIGTVVGQSDAYGIFLDPTGNAVLRLRTGETHEGWVLRSVSVRDTLLQNGRNSVVLALPASGSGGATPTVRGPDGPPLLARPGRPAGDRPTAHIVAPNRPPPALSDIESSH